MDRFIEKGTTIKSGYDAYLKSNMDRFIGDT